MSDTRMIPCVGEGWSDATQSYRRNRNEEIPRSYNGLRRWIKETQPAYDLANPPCKCGAQGGWHCVDCEFYTPENTPENYRMKTPRMSDADTKL